MELVLRVAITATTVRMVLVEGAAADGRLVDVDEFDVTGRTELSRIATDQVVSAILGTCESAAAQGHRLVGATICYADDIDADALRAVLNDNGLTDVVLVDERQAAEAQAHLSPVTSLPGSASAQPQLGLARGATLADISSGGDNASTVALAYSQDPDPPPEPGTSDMVALRGTARANPEIPRSQSANPLPVCSAATAAALAVATALGITLMVDISPTVDQQRRSGAATATPNVVTLSPPAAAPTAAPTPAPPAPAATAPAPIDTPSSTGAPASRAAMSAAPRHSTEDPDPTVSGLPESVGPGAVSAVPPPAVQTPDASAAPASPALPSAAPPQPHASFAGAPEVAPGVAATGQTALPPSIFLPLIPRWLRPPVPQRSASNWPPTLPDHTVSASPNAGYGVTPWLPGAANESGWPWPYPAP